MVEEIEEFIARLSDLRDNIKGNLSLQISRKNLRSEATGISKKWLSSLSVQIRSRELIQESIVNDYDSKFDELMNLSSSVNRKTSYLKLLKSLQSAMQKDILIPIIKQQQQLNNPLLQSVIVKINNSVINNQEREFFNEAFKAASNQCLKAAVVMVWCAVISRLQNFVERRGFQEFNKVSKKLKAKNKGLYKKFNKEYNISYTNELQEVFDKDLIMVISGMVDLDANIISAIINLFATRNSCAHPSDYIMDDLAFVNYLNEIEKLVLTNPKLN